MDGPTSPTPDPGDRRPTDRRPGTGRRAPLERPPGERYTPPDRARATGAGATGAGAGGAETRSRTVPPLAGAVLAALGGAALLVVLGGVLSLSVGLLVVAGGAAWLIGRSLAARPGPARLRRALAVALAVGSVALGQLGLWVFARSQGGALAPMEYLQQTWGLLVPLELAVAALSAWFASR